MSNIVDLVEAGQAADFQTAINERLSEKVSTILTECQAYIASRLFETVGDGAGEETPGEDADAPHDDDDNNEHV